MVSRLELSTQELGFIGLWIRAEAAARDTRDRVTRGHTRRSHLRDRDRFFLLSCSGIDVRSHTDSYVRHSFGSLS